MCELVQAVINGKQYRRQFATPFAGSGTAGAVALAHGRSFIGIEINSNYVKMGKRRTESTAPLFTESG